MAHTIASPGRMRAVRFALVGSACAAAQLVILAVLSGSGLNAFTANAIGFLVSAQLNFALSQTFTWRERTLDPNQGGLLARWLTFHACIAGTAALNLLTFAIAQRFAPHLAAAALGIAIASGVNFVANDRWTFADVRHRMGRPDRDVRGVHGSDSG